MNNIEKKIGYTLLIIGLLLIILPLAQTYFIFTGKIAAPQVFTPPKLVPTSANNNPFDIQQQVQQALLKVLPLGFIDTTLNIITWMILMGVLMFGGGKLADIGIKLIK